MKSGDFVKITLQDFIHDVNDSVIPILGTILQIRPVMPHVDVYPPLEPGPVYEIKILTVHGQIWESLIDQRDLIEIIKEY